MTYTPPLTNLPNEASTGSGRPVLDGAAPLAGVLSAIVRPLRAMLKASGLAESDVGAYPTPDLDELGDDAQRVLAGADVLRTAVGGDRWIAPRHVVGVIVAPSGSEHRAHRLLNSSSPARAFRCPHQRSRRSLTDATHSHSSSRASTSPSPPARVNSSARTSNASSAARAEALMRACSRKSDHS